MRLQYHLSDNIELPKPIVYTEAQIEKIVLIQKRIRGVQARKRYKMLRAKNAKNMAREVLFKTVQIMEDKAYKINGVFLKNRMIFLLETDTESIKPIEIRVSNKFYPQQMQSAGWKSKNFELMETCRKHFEEVSPRA